jgi:hypothetical protein
MENQHLLTEAINGNLSKVMGLTNCFKKDAAVHFSVDVCVFFVLISMFGEVEMESEPFCDSSRC